jgi:hypothetical protein
MDISTIPILTKISFTLMRSNTSPLHAFIGYANLSTPGQFDLPQLCKMEDEVEMFWLLNNSIGKVLRTLQSMLIPRTQKSMLDYLHENAMIESALFAENNMAKAVIFNTREELFDFLARNYSINDDSKLICEFGVFEGESINLLARLCPKSRIVGFDSFEGLRESMGGYRLTQGHFNLDGIAPLVGGNVKLIKGFFEDTVEQFVLGLDGEKIAMLHLDSDTYESTKFVLEKFSGLLSSGTLIVFDEFFGIPGWKNHEFKAWSEFSHSEKLQYSYVAFTNTQVAIEIK